MIKKGFIYIYGVSVSYCDDIPSAKDFWLADIMIEYFYYNHYRNNTGS